MTSGTAPCLSSLRESRHHNRQLARNDTRVGDAESANDLRRLKHNIPAVNDGAYYTRRSKYILLIRYTRCTHTLTLGCRCCP